MTWKCVCTLVSPEALFLLDLVMSSGGHLGSIEHSWLSFCFILADGRRRCCKHWITYTRKVTRLLTNLRVLPHQMVSCDFNPVKPGKRVAADRYLEVEAIFHLYKRTYTLAGTRAIKCNCFLLPSDLLSALLWLAGRRGGQQRSTAHMRTRTQGFSQSARG